MLDKEELVRPIHPISFTMGSNLIEVWYQKGIYLVMICSCLPQKGFHATNGMECAHIQILKKNFFPVLLWRIFQKRKAEIANF
ncbi:MAG: hypothetical protein D6785_09470 [Planctomycetota bacterium]|nr:MAG: hypothetical protein D6785_09470 [Planctomycetota bacterium]